MNLTAERITAFARQDDWYHTIELMPGIVTKGNYDHRKTLGLYKFESYVPGNTVLDVGAADGFFSFHFESIGASRVIALEPNLCNGEMPYPVSYFAIAHYQNKYREFYERASGFFDVYDALEVPRANRLLAARALRKSSVEVVHKSLFDFGESTKYDVVFCGALIEHLKSPIEAVEILRSMTGKVCIITLSSAIKEYVPRFLSRGLGGLGRAVRYSGYDSGGSFFHFSAQSFRRLCLASGFRDVEELGRYTVAFRRYGSANRNVIFKCVP